MGKNLPFFRTKVVIWGLRLCIASKYFVGEILRQLKMFFPNLYLNRFTLCPQGNSGGRRWFHCLKEVVVCPFLRRSSLVLSPVPEVIFIQLPFVGKILEKVMDLKLQRTVSILSISFWNSWEGWELGFSSFLQCQFVLVLVGGALLCRMPQVSILSPMLFNIYTKLLISQCLMVMRVWMGEETFQLNLDKTEWLWVLGPIASSNFHH